MFKLYVENEANYPRLKTDKFFADYDNGYKFNGFVDDLIKYIEDFQLLSKDLWQRFCEQFTKDADYDAGWRGEYWGKMMRGASFVYSYTKNAKLYSLLEQTVKDMMDTADDSGRISSYDVSHEFDGWDIWSRKYVLLGMQYFLEICTDQSLKNQIIHSMTKQLDYIISKIGLEEDGKILITKASRHWRGVNSSSLLEPVVRLYNITKKKEYLDFAAYIVNLGGTEVENIFELAYEDNMFPYQYPITKAYEVTSCFEGLLEYYRVTGVEKYKQAVINFANKVLESDFTIIGSCGCTNELFDHSTVRQANTTNENIMQETCVTVTLMKFMYQLTLLTGDSKYSDAFEISFYNAYLGAINTDKVIEPTIKRDFPDCHLEPLPFDSYSPLTAGTRGNGVGGFRIMEGNYYYGCCACIGSAGLGLISKMTALTAKDGIVLNMYFDGKITTCSPNGNKITFDVQTKYPKDGDIKINLNVEKEENFKIYLRNPSWSEITKISLNGKDIKSQNGYIVIEKLWQNDDQISIEFDMRTKVIKPIPYGGQIIMVKNLWKLNYVVPTYDKQDELAKNHLAFQRGPITLAQENRLGYSVDDAADFLTDGEYIDAVITNNPVAPYKNILEVELPLKNGNTMHLTDYSSAGKLWTEESKMAAWIKVSD